MYQQGQTGQARNICLALLENMPGNPKLIHFHGLIFLREQNFPAAVQWIEHAIRLQPKNPLYHNNLGNTFRSMGKPEQALLAYQAAVRIKPDFAPGYNNLGMVSAEQGVATRAACYYEKAIAADPGFFQAFNNLGELHRKQGHPDKAMALFERALAITPGQGVVHYNIGVLHLEAHCFENAVACFQKALSCRYRDKKLFNNIGVCLGKLNRYDAAATYLANALEMDPEYADAHSNLGEIFLSQCDIQGALDRFEQAIQLDPDHATARLNRAVALLTQGNFQEGWPGYKWRWEKQKIAPPDFGLPCWDGKDTKGGHILVMDEQGFGDVIQFARYLPMVQKTGGPVIFKAPRALAKLFSQCRCIEEIWVPQAGETSPPDKAVCQVPLMDLPALFNTARDNIPANVPYLGADKALVPGWEKRLVASPGLKVGVVWAGSPGHENDLNRSCRLELFLNLSTLPDTVFYSLQKEIGPGDASALEKNGIADLGTRLRDFADTAAALSVMDLVISVDTATAHLSGAMGKQTWTLLPFSPDWRWMLERRDSPWYPTMTLFRQPRPGDWDTVFAEIASALTAAIKRNPAS